MEEHLEMINKLITKEYNNILDLGSGKTSMNILLNKFSNSNITGICYPGDVRKLNSIRENCIGKFDLIEMDICKNRPDNEFDLVLCHLLLGETLKFGNNLENMLNSVFNIRTKEICIVDYLEDIDIDFDLVKKVANEKGFKLVNEYILDKKEKEQYNTFIGEHYIRIIIQAINIKKMVCFKLKHTIFYC